MSRPHPIHHRRHHDVRRVSAPTNDTTSNGVGRAPIHAQRFRTKLCDKFATTGSCPYVHRCMFAHGEAELRTTAQNVADGLVNETSIRKYKRAQYEARKRIGRGKGVSAPDSPPPPPPVAAADVAAPAAQIQHAMPVTVVANSHRHDHDDDDDLPQLSRRVPSVASLLARAPGDHDDDDDDALYGAADVANLSDSDHAYHHLRRRTSAATPTTAAASVPRFRHDPYSVECPERLCTPKKAGAAAQHPPPPPADAGLLPPSLIALRPESEEGSAASSGASSVAVAPPSPVSTACFP